MDGWWLDSGAAAVDPLGGSARPGQGYKVLTESPGIEFRAQGHRQLAEWNDTARAYPRCRCIHELFETQVAKSPDATAIIFGNRRLTYGALDVRTGALAQRLLAEGVAPGTPVALCVRRSADMIVGMLGILKAGGAYVPIEPDCPPSRMLHILGARGVKLILSQSELEGRLAGIGRRKIWLDRLDGSAGQGESPRRWGRDARSCEQVLVESTSPAYVIHAPQFPGASAGLAGSHRNVVNLVHWMQEEFEPGPGEIACQQASIASVGHVGEVFCALLAGMPLAIIPDRTVWDTVALLRSLDELGVTRLTATPSMLQRMAHSAASYRPRHLRCVFSAGDFLPVPVVREFRRQFPGTRLVNVYRLAGAGAAVCYHEIRSRDCLDSTEYFATKGEGVKPAGGRPSLAAGQALSQDVAITTPAVNLEELKECFRDTSMPESPMALDDYVRELQTNVLPYIVNVSSPAFIGHMTSALPSFVPEISRLAAELNQNMAKVETSKALTFVERQLMAVMHKVFFRGAESV